MEADILVGVEDAIIDLCDRIMVQITCIKVRVSTSLPVLLPLIIHGWI